MTAPYTANAEALAEAHWSYIDGILIAHAQHESLREMIRYHYITAFKHGYKHALEDIESGMYGEHDDGGLGGK